MPKLLTKCTYRHFVDVMVTTRKAEVVRGQTPPYRGVSWPRQTLVWTGADGKRREYEFAPYLDMDEVIEEQTMRVLCTNLEVPAGDFDSSCRWAKPGQAKWTVAPVE